MLRASRRYLPVLILSLALLPGVATPAGAQEASPAVPAGEIPPTPVGEQLAWVLDQLNGDAATLTEADLVAHVAQPFFAAFLPAPALLDLLRQTATTYAPVTFTGFAFSPTPSGAVALVETTTGERAAIYITVEAAQPHRITRLELNEVPPPASATGRRVRIGERAIYLDCTGTGAPTVVLEGGIASDWSAVQPAVTSFTRVCSYDRPDSPGSRSDPTADRTAQEVVVDLRALLTAAGEVGPYVLVGHSMGGLYVRLYASEHPDEIAGLVLVDPTPEDFSERLREMVVALGTPVPEPSGEPTAEETSFAQMKEARAAHPLRPMPLVVLSHGRADDPSERPPGWPIQEEERILRELHDEIAHLVPGGRHIIAEESGHDIHKEQPELVVEAIREVVTAVRDPSTWATPSAALPVLGVENAVQNRHRP